MENEVMNPKEGSKVKQMWNKTPKIVKVIIVGGVFVGITMVVGKYVIPAGMDAVPVPEDIPIG